MSRFKREIWTPGIGLTNLDTGKTKAITTIPGWAKDYIDEHAQGQGMASLAQLVMKSVWATRCIQLRANAIAAIPWVLQREAGDEVEEVYEHPLADLLDRPDPDTGWADLIRITEMDMLIYGTAFWVKAAAANQVAVSGLRRLNPLTMSVEKDASGIQGFTQEIEGSKVADFEREEVIYFRDPHPVDDLGGLSVTSVCRQAIEVEVNCDRYLASFFDNYAIPAAYISTEQELNQGDWEKLKERFRRLFRGVSRQHQTAFLDRGMEIKAIGGFPKDMALEVIRAEARRSICAAYGVPPAIGGAWEAANYATSVEQRQSLYSDTTCPRADYIANVLNLELVPYFDPSITFAFDYSQLDVMQEDLTAKANRMAALVNAKIITPLCAAHEMDYADEDVPEPAPVPEQLKPWVGKPEEIPEEKPELPDEEDTKAELRSWRRKALKRLKDGKKAAVAFKSKILPASLSQAIFGSLEGCDTPDDVSAVFAAATKNDFAHAAPAGRMDDDDMNEKTMLEFAKIMAEAMRPAQPAQPSVVIHQPNMTMDSEAIADAIKSAMLTAREERPVTVNVAAPEVTVAAPEVRIDNQVNVPEPSTKAAAEVMAPKLKRSRAKQKVTRSKGGIVGSEIDTTYEYEE